MRLDEYQWSKNPRGMHVTPNFLKPNLDIYRRMRMGWIKLVPSKDEYLGDVKTFNQSGITPIIRIYFERPGARIADQMYINLLTAYVGAGARWFEFYNEPNLPIEWPVQLPPDYRDTQNVLAPLVSNWLDWAEQVIAVGGYPGFPALAETVGGGENVNGWLRAMMEYLARNYYDRFRKVANSGLWVATHPYFYNHYYQEAGSPTSARQPDAQNGAEGGWHFEYPLDPITQKNDPGRGVLQGTPKEPFGDPIGLIGVGAAFMQLYSELFGGNMLPVVGTEGGITPIPKPNDLPVQPDVRFPGFNFRSHGEATLAAFNWIGQQAPAWMFGLCLWKEDDYMNSGPAAAVDRLAQTFPIYKSVPPEEALGKGGPKPREVVIPGPGPIHGQPDLHWLILYPEFNTETFLNAAKDYWEKYRPTILFNLDLIAQIPSSKSLAVTLISPPNRVDAFKQAVKDRGVYIYVDSIGVDTADQLTGIFIDRLKNDARFG
jgi:hypothetical protein